MRIWAGWNFRKGDRLRAAIVIAIGSFPLAINHARLSHRSFFIDKDTLNNNTQLSAL